MVKGDRNCNYHIKSRAVTQMKDLHNQDIAVMDLVIEEHWSEQARLMFIVRNKAHCRKSARDHDHRKKIPYLL